MGLFINNDIAAAAPNNEAKVALEKLQKLTSEVTQAERAYEQAIYITDEAEKAIAELEPEIKDLQQRIDALKIRIEERVVVAYKIDSSDMLDFILSSRSFNELEDNIYMLNKFNTSDSVMIDELSKLQDELYIKEIELTEKQNAASTQKIVAKKIVENSVEKQNEIQQIYNSLSDEALASMTEELVSMAMVSADDANNAIARAQELGLLASDGDYEINLTSPVLTRAYAWLGKSRYVWGGCSPGAFDCSGFVSYCLTGQYKRIGTTYTFIKWKQIDNPIPGDVCVNWEHCGLYIGDGMMIHCTGVAGGVIIGPVQSGMIFVRYQP